MGVGCQSRRFNYLFWRETRQRILGHEISPYPEVVRGGEWELTTRARERESWWLESRERQLVAGDQERQLVAGEEKEELVAGPERELVAGDQQRSGSWTRERSCGWTGERRTAEVGVEERRGSQHQTPSREARREDRVQWRRVSRCLIPVALWNFR